MKPWSNIILFGIVTVVSISSRADAQALPSGFSRIVFHGNRVVRFAYVPERTRAGVPLHWPGSCVFIRPHSAGTTHIDGDGEQAVIAGVLDHWQTSTRACGYLSFMLEPPEAGEVGLDYVNRIVFREDRWCRPATATSAEECYDPMVGAVTSLIYVDTPGDPNDGTILDVDIEINAVDYSVGICDLAGCTTAGTAPVVQDLANQLTHEIGHLVGLGHTCRTESEPMGTDTDEEPIPSCTDPDLSFEARTATMYPVSLPQETRRASLAPRDIEDFCEIYPLAEDPETCTPATPISPVPPDAGSPDAGPPDTGPPARDGGTDADPPADEAGTDAQTDSATEDAARSDSGTADLGTTLPDAGTMEEPDATIRRDGAIHTVPPMEDGCACAVGQPRVRLSWTTLVLLGLTVAALLRCRRRH